MESTSANRDKANQVQNLLGYYIVVATLIVTVTYASVLTPPKVANGASDLSFNTITMMVLGMRAGFGACLPEGMAAPIGGTCSQPPMPPLDDADFPWGTLDWDEQTAFIMRYVAAMKGSLQALDPNLTVERSGPLATAYQWYALLNACALLFSIFSIATGVMFMQQAMDQVDRDSLRFLTRLRTAMEALLFVSLTCLLLAMMFAHYFVYQQNLIVFTRINRYILFSWFLAMFMLLCLAVAVARVKNGRAWVAGILGMPFAGSNQPAVALGTSGPLPAQPWTASPQHQNGVPAAPRLDAHNGALHGRRAELIQQSASWPLQIRRVQAV